MWSRMRSWVRGILRRGRVETELADELRFHLQAREAHWRREGLSPGEAARRARLEFGAVDAYKERCREARGLRLLDELRSDVRFGWRLMRRAPAVTAVIVTTLALSIGANTAIFTLVDAVLLKMLPVSRPQELRILEWTARRWGFSNNYNGNSSRNAAGERVATSFAYPVYTHVRDHATSFTGLAAFEHIQQASVAVGGRAEAAHAQLVSGNLFRILGVDAVVGRALLPEDDRAGAPSAAVVSYGFWQRTLGGSPSALGQAIAVDGVSVTIVGIMPPRFCGLNPGTCVDVMVPLALQPAIARTRGGLENARRWAFPVIGRLRAGVTDAQASAEAETLVRQAILASRPEGEYDLPRIGTNPFGQGLDELRRTVDKPLRVLMAFVGIVLLIACANIAGLLLTRAKARQRELSSRLALGASRARLARQLLTESLVLSGLGGALGIGLALALRPVLPFALAEESIQLDVAPGWWMLAFSTGICVLAGVLSGVLPALGAARVGLVPALGRSTVAADAPQGRFWSGKALVIVQVALSLVLLVGAGLFVRTLLNLRSAARGLDPDRLLLFQLNGRSGRYEGSFLNDFYEEILRRVESVPGVRAVSISRWGVLSRRRTTDAIWTAKEAAGATTGVHLHYIAPRYFETMGVPLLLGRDLTWSDREGAPRVAVVNQALATRFFHDEAAVGGSFWFRGADVANRIEIVGVVGDVHFSTLREAAPPTVYLPFRQSEQHQMTFAIRAFGEPLALVEPVRRAIASVDPNVPMFDVRTQQAQIDRSMQQERVFAHLLTGFASLAVLLACVGIYGTLAYWVAWRTPEIGVRMALGADRGHVVRMVVGEMAVPVVVGLAVGLGVAIASTRILESLLFGLTPRDVTSIVGAAAALLGSATLAAWLPSRRASRVDPIAALRQD